MSNHVSSTTIIQSFGDQRFVNGDNVERGSIDKRQGIFTERGKFYGPVVGSNGNITIGNDKPVTTTPPSLQAIHRQVQEAIVQAQRQMNYSLVIALQYIEIDLKEAIRTEQDSTVPQQRDQLEHILEELNKLGKNVS